VAKQQASKTVSKAAKRSVVKAKVRAKAPLKRVRRKAPARGTMPNSGTPNSPYGF